MKKMKFVIAFVIITNIILLNICYGKEVMINENEFDNLLVSSFIKSLPNNIFTVEDEKDDLVKIIANNKSFWIQKKYVKEVNTSANNVIPENDAEVLEEHTEENVEENINIVKKIVNTDVLNVRSSNSVNSEKVGTLRRNIEVEVSYSENGWDYIKANELKGWVSSDYLILPGDLTENVNNNQNEITDRGINKEVYITANSLNVRDAASVSANKIGSLPYFKTVNVVSVEDEWYKIEYNGGYGYISAQYAIDKTELASRGNYDRDYSSVALASKLADNALTQVGNRYVYGGATPNGFDCSGLVYYTYKPYANNLPRSASKQAQVGTFVDKSNLQKGDLVFFGNNGRGVIEHVGIYIGDGMFVHAATTKRGVVTDTLNSGYYCTNYITARRVI